MPHWYEDKKPYRDYDEDGRDGRATRDARLLRTGLVVKDITQETNRQLI